MIWPSASRRTRSPSSTTCQRFAPRLALTRNESSKAIEALQAAAPYELGTPGMVLSALWLSIPSMCAGRPMWPRIRAAKPPPSSRKSSTIAALCSTEPIGALAHLGLARAYALQGDAAKARAAYNDFFTLWKDADPDIPILIAAKSEYAKLK